MLTLRDRSRRIENRPRRSRSIQNYRGERLEAELENLTRRVESLAVDIQVNQNDIKQTNMDIMFLKFKPNEHRQTPHQGVGWRRRQQKANAAKVSIFKNETNKNLTWGTPENTVQNRTTLAHLVRRASDKIQTEKESGLGSTGNRTVLLLRRKVLTIYY